MNNFIYKIKNKLFRYSNEALKTRGYSENELLKYKFFNKNDFNKLIISFGAGRCGQNWVAKIFNSHKNWIGSAERYSDFEAFYRFVTFYKLPIDKENFFKFYDLALKRDFSNYVNSFIASPYFSFGITEIITRFKPDYLFFNLRNPVRSVESLYRKGWYLNNDEFFKYNRGPSINMSINIIKNFSRIIPNDDFYKEWLGLSRIGKIAWFWSIINKSILENFEKINNIEKYILKLEDIDQNYDFYKSLSKKFSFENVMDKKSFYNVIYKAPNKGPNDKYKFKDWTVLEKKEFEDIIEKFFPYYDTIETNI